MAETGTVKFFLGQGYGFIVPDSGGRDVHFRLEAVRVPKVDDSGRFGWDYPKNGQTPPVPKGGDRVVFIRIVDKEGRLRAIRWAFLDAHEKVVDVLWDQLAKFSFPNLV